MLYLFSTLREFLKEDTFEKVAVLLMCLGGLILYLSLFAFVIFVAPWWGGIVFFGASLVVLGWFSLIAVS
jgi:hypothetical protein